MEAVEVTVSLPREIAADIVNGSNTSLGRRLLELAAIQAHQADLITSRQVQEMLGFEDREELFAFFKANDVRDHSYTMEEHERGMATLTALLDKR